MLKLGILFQRGMSIHVQAVLLNEVDESTQRADDPADDRDPLPNGFIFRCAKEIDQQAEVRKSSKDVLDSAGRIVDENQVAQQKQNKQLQQPRRKFPATQQHWKA